MDTQKYYRNISQKQNFENPKNRLSRPLMLCPQIHYALPDAHHPKH